MLEQQLATSQAEIQRLTTAYDALQATNVSLTTAVEELRSNLATLTDTHSSGSDQAAALSSSLAQAQASENATRHQLEALKSEMEEVEKSRLRVEEELATCRGEVEETSTTLAAAMTELDATKEECLDLEKAVEDAREEARLANAAKASIEQEKQQAASTVDSLTDRLSESTIRVTELEEQVRFPFRDRSCSFYRH
jgi:chromosome segregation ATPase